MKDILAARHLPVLQRLARSRALLVFDHHGALASAAAEPSQTVLAPRTRELLATVAERYPCTVIAGLPREFVVPELEGVPVQRVYGCHGADGDEPTQYQAQVARIVTTWLAPLERLVSRIAGVVLEPFTYSVMLSLRKTRDPARALAQIREAAADLPACRLVTSEGTVSVVPALAPSTTGLVDSLARACGAACALFVGAATEDNQRSASAGRLQGEHIEVISVQVGRRGAACSDFYLSAQERIDELLRRLVDLRDGRLAPT